MITFLLAIIFLTVIFWLISRIFIVRMVSKHQRQNNYEDPARSGRKEGEVFVSKGTDEDSDDKKIVEKGMGEYVEYEAVKEDKDGDI